MPADVRLRSVVLMSIQQAAIGPREQLLTGAPVEERRLLLADISTPLLEGGEGPPLVLLHGPAGNATHWLDVISELVRTRRVIAPDLPGHGASKVGAGRLDAERVLAWLGELIDHTCSAPPTLVAQTLGGAIAARFAARAGTPVDRLVLVDTLGLRAFEPAPAFAEALNEFLAQPSDRTHDALWRQCALDFDRLRSRMGPRWEPFKAYTVDRMRTPNVHAALTVLWGLFGSAPIPARELERIAVPTSLIWGRHDIATPLEVAQAEAARRGWPLHVIEDCADDPPVEQPEAFCDALRSALDEKEAA
jgi:pimeloyl-ACP methyl ester carboxylesterase